VFARRDQGSAGHRPSSLRFRQRVARCQHEEHERTEQHEHGRPEQQGRRRSTGLASAALHRTWRGEPLVGRRPRRGEEQTEDLIGGERADDPGSPADQQSGGQQPGLRGSGRTEHRDADNDTKRQRCERSDEDQDCSVGDADAPVRELHQNPLEDERTDYRRHKEWNREGGEV
jgi:hypothetical protein